VAGSEFRDFECIVVDDASTDDTRAIAAQHGATVVVALDHNSGPATARNRGAEHARGEFLVFIDADVLLHPDTLTRFDAHLRANPGTDAVMGSYDDQPADPGFISQYKNLFHHYVHHHSSTDAWTFWAGCGAVRRAVFQEVGGFDESYRRPCIEDIELGFRLRKRGHRIDLDPAIRVTHLKRWTFWGLVRTDVRDRGIPWLLLMLRDRTMPPDMNVARSHRLSVVAVFAMVALIAAALGAPLLGVPDRWLATGGIAPLGVLLLAGALVGLNYDLYRFFGQHRGLWFAAGTLPLHWLYYFYCGLSLAMALGIHLWRTLLSRHPRLGPASRSVEHHHASWH
jgi:hypothetical protein